MNWDAIGAAGEIIGATGVLISLLYLASQIRKNTHAIESSAHQGMLHQHNSLWTLLLTDENLGRIGRAWRR